MSRAKKERRAVVWGRHVALLDAAPAALMVHSGAVWRIDLEAITADWLLADRRLPPPGAERQTEQDLERLRRAIAFVEHGRSLGELTDRGLPGTKRLRGLNLTDVTAAATRQVECLAWALTAAPDAPVGERPQGVMIESSHLTPRRRDWGELPSSHVVAPDLAVADRLFDLYGMAMADRWLRSARECWWPARQLSSKQRLPCLQILLRTPHASFAIGREAGLDCLRAVAALLGAADRDWADAAGEFVPEWLTIGVEPAPWLSGVPVALTMDVLRHWPVPVPARGWSRNVGGLRRYLRELEAGGPPGSAAGQWLRQQWVVELLTSPFADSALAITAVAGRAAVGTEDAVSALVAGLFPGVPAVRRRLREWASPATYDVDVAELSKASGIEPAVLVPYLHHRRLAGDGERMPRDLAKLQCSDRAEEAEASVLRCRLEREELSEATRASLARRIEYLGDPTALEARRAARRRRLRNQLVRATADYRLRSLRRVLELSARDRLPDLRSGLPLSLLADLSWLVSDDGISQPLLRRFVDLALGGRSRYEWPENRRWVDASRSSFAVDRWLAGFDQTVHVGGQPVRYYAEPDPVRAVHMGTWFGTCLALDREGFNRFAALGNAIEANRHVVYATDRRGSVLARKLIAVAPPNRLLGYRTYAFADQSEHKRQLDQICAEFAETCGLTLSQVGTPEAIVGESLWYDDGTEPWLVSAGTPDAERRELMSDDEIEGGDYGLDADLIHGLWLDGRLSASQRAAAVARETRQCGCGGAVGSVPLFDPTGFAEASRRYTGPPGSMDGVELRPDRALIEAATRIASAIDGALLQLLPLERALMYLRGVHSRQPSNLLLETLRVRGASLRKLRTVAVASTHRCFAEFGDLGQGRQAQAAALAHVRLRLASEQQLRRMLEAPTTASSAAYELACRGSGAHAEAIGVASARAPWNETLALAAAAMRVGSPWDPARRVSPHADPALVGLAVAAGGVPARAVHRTDDFRRILYGHSELPPNDRKLTPLWESVRDLSMAFVEPCAVDWNGLAELLVTRPGAGSDRRVVRALARVIAGPDDVLLDCACAMGRAATRMDPAGLGPAPGVLDVIVEAVARDLVRGVALHDVSHGVMALVQVGERAAVGVLATLSELLPARERLGALTLADPDSVDSWPYLAWLLAFELRRAPELLDEIDPLDAVTAARLLAGLRRTLPTHEAQAIAANALARLAPDTLAEVGGSLGETSILAN